MDGKELDSWRVCFEDVVPLVIDLGSAVSSQDLAITVSEACSADPSLTSVLPCELHWHTGFRTLPSSHPKLSHSAESTVVPNGKHPSTIQIDTDGCEGVFKILQALQVGRQVGVVLLFFFFFSFFNLIS